MIVLLAILLAVPSMASAQEADTVASLSGVEIRTAVDRAEITVGDRISYTLVIVYDSTIELIPPPMGANLGAFQVLDYETDMMDRLPDGRVSSTSTFVVSTFTTGDYVIPPMPVMFDLPDSTRKLLFSEAVPITVNSLITGDDSLSAEIQPIAPPYAFKHDYTIYYIYGGVAALLLAVIAALYFRRRKRLPVAEPVDPRPAWEIAYERLALLQQAKLIESGGYKEYYYELSEALRWYLGRMYSRNVLDMTTTEFLEQFREVDLPDSLYDGLAAFLGHADLVKFAKYRPDPKQTGYDFNFVHNCIERVRSDYQRRQGPQTVTSTVGGGTR